MKIVALCGLLGYGYSEEALNIVFSEKVDFVGVDALRKIPLEITRTKLDLPYKTFDSYEITFNTHDDTVVSAYFSVPRHIEGPLPCVAYFTGGGGRKTIMPHIVSTGVCCFFMDVRSQSGTTFDKANYKIGDDYRGALSIVATALSGKIKKAYPAVPSYCCLPQRVEAGSGVFDATKKYLQENPFDVDKVFDTLSYFDINNMVSLLKAPVDFALGMIDPICIPEFVYSPYHHTASSEKQMFFYLFTPHCIPKDFELHALTEFSNL